MVLKHPLWLPVVWLLLCGQALAGWSAELGVETTAFLHAPLDSRQPQNNTSLSLQGDYYRDWDGGYQSLSFRPFMRLDQHDKQRNHADIRELSWLKAANQWELRAGIRQEHWGVTEAVNLVDIINQRDRLEGLKSAEKLGQPMLNLALIGAQGSTLDLYWLPLFRPQTFSGPNSRPRLGGEIQPATYSHADGDRHQDIALRWNTSVVNADVGLSWFRGTHREATLTPTANGQLTPQYDVIEQSGLDLQWALERWLWKVEVLQRKWQNAHYWASVSGFEYTFNGVADSQADLGVVMEYLNDQRDPADWQNFHPGRMLTTPFNDDFMLGLRLAINNLSSSDAFLGLIIDRKTGARVWSLQATQRLNETLQLSLSAQGYTHLTPTDLFYPLRQDDHASLQLTWYL